MDWRGHGVVAVALLVGGCGYPDYVYAEGDATPLGEDSTSTEGGGTEDGGTETGTDDACTPNGCGGCATPSETGGGVKGDRCDPCGRLDCDGTSVTCVQSMPAIGTTCGVCHTSKYACNTFGESVCAAVDDRVVSDDLKFEAKDQVVFTLDHTTELVATYTSTKSLTYNEAGFVLRRIPYVCKHVATLPHPDPACTDCMAASGGGFDCKIPSTLVSNLTVTLYKGSPKTTLTPIASGKLPDSSAVPTVPTLQLATYVMEAPPEPVGTQMSVGITTTSTAYAFEVSGGGTGALPPAPSTMSWFHRTILPTPGTFVEETATDTALTVHGKACP